MELATLRQYLAGPENTEIQRQQVEDEYERVVELALSLSTSIGLGNGHS